MPMDRSKYPANWDQISRRIRFERAEGLCEKCGVPHSALRAENGQWWLLEDLQDLWEWPEMDEDDAAMVLDKGPLTVVILTTAHLGIAKPDGTPGDKADTMHCREENLAALCQKCHLNFDRDQHIKNRLINRRRRLVEAGQQEMFT